MGNYHIYKVLQKEHYTIIESIKTMNDILYDKIDSLELELQNFQEEYFKNNKRSLKNCRIK